MTATSTSALFVSPAAGGPFGTPVWRIGTVAQLVEASGAPYWLIRNPDTGKDEYVSIPVMDDYTMSQSVLVVLALSVSSENTRQILIEHHNLIDLPDQLKVAEHWDLSDSEVELVLRDLVDRVRLGIICLEEGSLINDSVIQQLTLWGLQVKAFK